jgi:hypothetical protein
MGIVTKTLLLISGAFFFFVSLICAAEGNYRAATGGLVLFGFIFFIGLVGWFHFRFPLSPLPPDAPSPTTFSKIKRFIKHHPGWQGKVVKYGLPVLLGIAVLQRLVPLLRSILRFNSPLNTDTLACWLSRR